MTDPVTTNGSASDFRNRFAQHDWSSSGIGEPQDWPTNLKTVAELMLETRQPMFLTWGRNHSFLFNEAFAAILGEKYWEAMGASLPALWAGAWPEMGHFFEDAYAGNGAHVEDQRFATWASGYEQFRYYSFSYTPIRHNDKVQGVMCVCTDTTDKVEARELVLKERDALWRAFEQAPGFIAMTEGPDHRFTFANGTYRRLAGERELVGKTVAEALPEFLEQGLIAVLDRVYETREPFSAQAMPVRLLASDGREEVRFVDFVSAARVTADGQVIGQFCEGQDVTERIESARKIRTLQSELIHASRRSAMDIMASTLAHELNQPLTAIGNYASAGRRFLNDGGIDDVRDSLDAIVEGAMRAGNVVRAARDLVEQRTSAFEAVNLNFLLLEAEQLIGCSQCEIAFDNEPGVFVLGDPVQIQQVILNLIKNACEAVASLAEPRILVRAHAVDNVVQTTVQDNGPGVAIEPIDSIFDALTTTKSDGMGLGLAISRTIIEAHGGRIWASTDPSGGTAVTFELPLSTGKVWKRA